MPAGKKNGPEMQPFFQSAQISPILARLSRLEFLSHSSAVVRRFNDVEISIRSMSRTHSL